MTFESYFSKFCKNIIGIEVMFNFCYGKQKLIYTDWTASGRLYEPIEKKMLETFGPLWAAHIPNLRSPAD